MINTCLFIPNGAVAAAPAAHILLGLGVFIFVVVVIFPPWFGTSHGSEEATNN